MTTDKLNKELKKQLDDLKDYLDNEVCSFRKIASTRYFLLKMFLCFEKKLRSKAEVGLKITMK